MTKRWTTYEIQIPVGQIPMTVNIPNTTTHDQNGNKNLPPIALLLGWAGASSKQLEKYGSIYRSMGYATASATAAMKTVFSIFPGAIPSFTRSVFDTLNKEVCRKHGLLTKNAGGGGGLVCHFFSNGGAFCMAALLNMWKNEDEEMKWIWNVLCAVVFDSSPCYMHDDIAASAFAAGVCTSLIGDNNQNNRVFKTSKRIFNLIIQMKYSVGLSNGANEFWSIMQNAKYPCHEFYVYSAMDKLLDAEKLDALLKKRQEPQEQNAVKVLRVDNSPHIMILRTHPQLYTDLIHQVNERGVNSWRKRNGISKWHHEGETERKVEEDQNEDQEKDPTRNWMTSMTRSKL